MLSCKEVIITTIVSNYAWSLQHAFNLHITSELRGLRDSHNDSHKAAIISVLQVRKLNTSDWIKVIS